MLCVLGEFCAGTCTEPNLCKS